MTELMKEVIYTMGNIGGYATIEEIKEKHNEIFIREANLDEIYYACLDLVIKKEIENDKMHYFWIK